MEDKKLNEQESLELITRMIQNSKRNLEVGSGNIFLLWGYLGAVVPLVIFVLVLLTKNHAWNWLWFLIPLVGWPMQYIMQKKEGKPVITYTDKALMAVWRTIGTMGMLGVFWLCLNVDNMGLMMPGVILVMALGVAVTGCLIESKFMVNSAYFSFGLALAASVIWIVGEARWNLYYILFSVCFVTMLVVPGHRVNRESNQNK